MATPIEQIKERLSIVDVVSTYIKIEKAGAQYKARCPFHNERTASFYVSLDRGSFHCFGCGVGGDIFTFVEKIEGLEFKDTLKLLADRAGVTLTKGGEKTDTELFDVLESAGAYFEHTLLTSPEALHYLKERGISEDTTKEFGIGFAKNEWRGLYAFLVKKGFSEKAMEATGLCIRTEKGLYDRFRGRVLFPIRNASGKIVGFSGRILPEFAEKELNAGKYINSPETVLYHKSKVLFGYDKAKRSINDESGCILVEGQMDLCMAHQAGTKNVVAVSGTALTLEHLHLIKRFTQKLILCLDTDMAGFTAAKKAAELALLSGMDVRAIILPEGKDPADLIVKDKELWLESSKKHVPIIEFLLTTLKKQHDERSFGLQVAQVILPLVSLIQNKIDQAFFVRMIASHVKAPEDLIWQQLSKIQSQVRLYEEKPIQKVVAQKTSAERAIEHSIGIAKILKNEDEVLIKLKAIVSGIPELEMLLEASKESQDAYAVEVEGVYEDKEKYHDILQGIFIRLKHEVLKSTLEKTMKAQQEAERSGDHARATELLLVCHQLSKEIEEMKQKQKDT